MSVSVKIDDREWRRIARNVEQLLKDQRVRVGILGDGRNATIGAVHEFGSPARGIPERSFLRASLRKMRATGQLAGMTERISRAILTGKLAPVRGLQMLGAWASAQVKSHIVDTNIPPPLSPRTIARKGSDRALVDTSQMLNAITWAVEGK